MDSVLGATEFRAVTPVLLAFLWIEAVFYLSFAAYKVIKDIARPAQKWTLIGNRLNSYIWHIDQRGNKSHTILAALVGFVALNGALEGKVTRFEMEFIFLSLAMSLWMVLTILPPSRSIYMRTLPFVPELHFQIVLTVFFWDWIRPEILFLCVITILAGMITLIAGHSDTVERIFTMDRFNADTDDAKPELQLKAFDQRRMKDELG